MHHPPQKSNGDLIDPARQEYSPSDVPLVRERLGQLWSRYVAEGLLAERDLLILQPRLGLPAGRYATLEEVSARVGVKRERVRQRQNLALRALRHRPEFAKLFASYLTLAPPPASRHRKPPWLDRDRKFRQARNQSLGREIDPQTFGKF